MGTIIYLYLAILAVFAIGSVLLCAGFLVAMAGGWVLKLLLQTLLAPWSSEPKPPAQPAALIIPPLLRDPDRELRRIAEELEAETHCRPTYSRPEVAPGIATRVDKAFPTLELREETLPLLVCSACSAPIRSSRDGPPLVSKGAN